MGFEIRFHIDKTTGRDGVRKILRVGAVSSKEYDQVSGTAKGIKIEDFNGAYSEDATSTTAYEFKGTGRVTGSGVIKLSGDLKVGSVDGTHIGKTYSKLKVKTKQHNLL